MPELDLCHFEGIPRAEIDFVIHHSRLCAIVSQAMRARWALRGTTESRIRATRDADEALARFTLQLPPGLQLSSPMPSNTWQSTLHLTYNNFLILLHRPAPKHSDRDQVSEACSDLSICGGAAMAISSIFETLFHGGTLSTLWLYGVHALFTAMIHVGNDLGSPNPLVSAKAQQMFGSLAAALRELAGQWRFALGLLRLFEQRASRMKSELSTVPSPADETQQISPENGRNNNAEFSLRPAPADPSIPPSSQLREYDWGGNGNDQDRVSAEPSSPSSYINGGHRFDGIRPSGEQYLSMGTDDMFLQDFSFPDASALEFFLADMDGTNRGFPSLA